MARTGRRRVILAGDAEARVARPQEILPKYRRDLVAKMKVLKAELSTLQPQSGHCRLEVSRDEVFEVRGLQLDVQSSQD